MLESNIIEITGANHFSERYRQLVDRYAAKYFSDDMLKMHFLVWMHFDELFKKLAGAMDPSIVLQNTFTNKNGCWVETFVIYKNGYSVTNCCVTIGSTESKPDTPKIPSLKALNIWDKLTRNSNYCDERFKDFIMSFGSEVCKSLRYSFGFVLVENKSAGYINLMAHGRDSLDQVTIFSRSAFACEVEQLEHNEQMTRCGQSFDIVSYYPN